MDDRKRKCGRKLEVVDRVALQWSMREAIILLVVVSLPHLCYTAGDCDVCSKFVEAFDRVSTKKT